MQTVNANLVYQATGVHYYHEYACMVFSTSCCGVKILSIISLLLFILIADGFLSGSSGTTIRRNTKITRLLTELSPS
jgi:hypothetical protein